MKGEQEHLADNQEQAGRSRLISRVVLVAGSIVALLAALLIFDHKNGQSDSAGSSANVAVANPPRIGVSVSTANPAQSMSDDLKQAIKDAPDSAQLALASMSEPVSSVVEVPVIPEATSDVVSASVAASSVAPKVQPRTGRAISAEQRVAESSRQPLQPTAAPSQVASVVPPPQAQVRDPGAFVLQLGVFSNPGNAEELHGKLKMAGIPSHLETRVQVGPFSSKEEAVKAQDKIRKLGLGSGMLVPANKKP